MLTGPWRCEKFDLDGSRFLCRVTITGDWLGWLPAVP